MAITCDALCQTPNLGTCAGITPGTCTNVNPGDQTCGLGVCQVTVPLCVAGSPNTCVPSSGAASAETCNDVDDDCDGTSDNGAFADGYEPNDGCGAFRTFPTVGSDQTLLQNTLTVFGVGESGLVDVEAFVVEAHTQDIGPSAKDVAAHSTVVVARGIDRCRRARYVGRDEQDFSAVRSCARSSVAAVAIGLAAGGPLGVLHPGCRRPPRPVATSQPSTKRTRSSSLER